MAKLETKKMLAAAVDAAQDKQAVDLRILELDPAESGLTDYFLVMSGTNSRQMQSISDEIELQMKQQFGNYANSREGYRQAEWILLDYVDFVVHIFSEEKRGFYDIERLRKSAHTVTPEELHAAMVEKVEKTRASRKTAGEGAAAEAQAGKSTPGAKPAGRKAAGKKQSIGKPAAGKTAGAKKAAARKGVSRKSAGKPGARKTNAAAGGDKPIARGKNKLKRTPKSTPKSRKRS